ncbi:glycosyl transferase group 1 protein [Listeria fleischmannii 1991]|uniref:Glycosyl transferase group 1 protein n=1 Tax=Listeria fleischmannii 1991 TaxID=1430899 RepID=A0A0J8J059_9LIST|nr:glycosyltransferase [Listeria fleischmannii]EMG28720.1 glycosyl transferase group 1 protein [Listeria fleischmannii subsp. fleischmannii LU2006-1]KMT57696.1 glycosyl transferase group 1 protein [Listeria fleischmannii 1991]
MKKRVTMFLWNGFTNDARVLRECTALLDAGYFVQLIALKNTQPAIQIESENFRLHRISRQLIPFQKTGLFLIGIIITMFAPLLGALFFVFLLILLMTKLHYLVRNLILIGKMTAQGMIMRTDIYHANDLNTLLQAVLCSKVKRKKLIFDSHEINTSRSGYDLPIYRVFERLLIRFPDYVIHENDTRAKYFRRVYGFNPEVIYNYPFLQKNTDKIDLHNQLQLAETEPILLYQGGLQIGRGLENLLAAVPLFEKGTVVFIGDGKLKQTLKKATQQANLMHRVKFIEKVPVEELPLYTRNAYLGFQLLNNTCFNHFTAASNKLFEYMMAGVPVISCSFPEMKKVINDSKTGILVDSSDPVSIANAVNQLLKSPDLRSKMSERSLEAREIYNWEKEKIKFLNIYQKLSEDEKK